MHSVRIERPQYKFSAAHMTVFADGSKERLHGHNYQLAAELFLHEVALPVMCDFSILKDGLKAVCAGLNERTLVALYNPFLQVVTEDGPYAPAPIRHLRLRHRDGDYLLPAADVALLPIDNVTAERLAEHCHGLLAEYLLLHLPPAVKAVLGELEVGVYELPGQGARYRAPLEKRPPDASPAGRTAG